MSGIIERFITLWANLAILNICPLEVLIHRALNSHALRMRHTHFTHKSCSHTVHYFCHALCSLHSLRFEGLGPRILYCSNKLFLLGWLSCNINALSQAQNKWNCNVKIRNISHFAFYIRESATRKIHQKIYFQHASCIFIPISCILRQVLTQGRLHFLHRSVGECWGKRLL